MTDSRGTGLATSRPGASSHRRDANADISGEARPRGRVVVENLAAQPPRATRRARLEVSGSSPHMAALNQVPARGTTRHFANRLPSSASSGERGRPASAKPSSTRIRSAAIGTTGHTAAPGGFRVQLGAFLSPRNANAARMKALRAAPDLGNKIRIKPGKSRDGGTVYRLWTDVPSERAAADALCARLKARSVSCFVVPATRS